MPDDIDIIRAAKVLIDQHGADASIQAAMKADRMLDKGDLDGQRMWQRVLAAVDELQSDERPEGVAVH